MGVMPRPPAFSRDLLIRLLRSGEYSSYAEVADALSAYGETATPATITVAVHRLRKGGEDLPEFGTRHGETLAAQLVANTGRKVARDCWNHVWLQRLRQVSALRAGRPLREDLADLARKFESELRTLRRVVDLDAEGRPYIRPAFPVELDAAGNIVDIIAQPRVTEGGHGQQGQGDNGSASG